VLDGWQFRVNWVRPLLLSRNGSAWKNFCAAR
jgi:hypothetical protein